MHIVLGVVTFGIKISIALHLLLTVSPCMGSSLMLSKGIGRGRAPWPCIDVAVRGAIPVVTTLIDEGKVATSSDDGPTAVTTLLMAKGIAFFNLAKAKLFPGTTCVPPEEISAKIQASEMMNKFI